MSSRYYPLFIKGGPRLRVFLPNFWMKLAKASHPIPNNQVAFIVSMEMTKYDVKNYLEKIYNVPVKEVRTHIAQGRFVRVEEKGYVVKKDDEKWAYVTLPEGATFTFPKLESKEAKDQFEKDMKVEKETHANFKAKQENQKFPGVPMWFSD